MTRDTSTNGRTNDATNGARAAPGAAAGLDDIDPDDDIDLGNGPAGGEARQEDASPRRRGRPPRLILPGYSDMAVAERMVRQQNGRRVRLYPTDEEMVFDEATGIWTVDPRPDSAVVTFVREEIAAVQRLVGRPPAPGREPLTEEDAARIVAELSTNKKQEAILRVARRIPGTRQSAEDWVENPDLLGTPKCVVDLNTFGMRPGEPRERVSKRTAVAPDFDTEPETWLRFLADTFPGDPDTVETLQQWCGYSLGGSVEEQKLLFFYGGGNNGKGTFLDTGKAIMGEYAHVIQSRLLTRSRFPEHSTTIAQLRGKRFVPSGEISEAATWDEAMIKTLTGDGYLNARGIGQDPFNFPSTAKLILVGNHMPEATSVGRAMRRRLHFVPFTHTVEDKDVDVRLGDKLKAEHGAILAWMIEGRRKWRKHGRLFISEAIHNANREYWGDQDVLDDWIANRCLCGSRYKEKRSRLFEDFTAYIAKNSPNRRISKMEFKARLEGKPFPDGKGTITRAILHGIEVFNGIKLGQDETNECAVPG